MAAKTVDGMLPSAAARALGLSPSRVRDLVAEGRLTATQTAYGKLIDVQSVQAEKARRDAAKAATS